VSSFTSREEAKSARDQARIESRHGVFVAPSKITVEAHFDEWFEIKKEKLKPKTADGYRQCLTRYIIPRFGSTYLKDLTPGAIEQFYLFLSKSGGKKDQALAKSTVRFTSIVLAQGLERAVKDRKISFNPAKGIELPNGAKRVREPFTVTEFKVILSALEEHRLFAFFRLSAYSGARRGELCALKWSDVDLERGTVSISRNRQRVLTQIIEQESTKGGHGRRTVEIDTDTCRILKTHKVNQNLERLKIGQYWQETGYIFVQENGLPIDPDTPSKIFQRYRLKLGLRSQSVHDLRHLHATELLRSGVSAHLVRDRLGHRDISVTLDVYGHIRADQKREVANQFASAIDNG
jgi:integrase